MSTFRPDPKPSFLAEKIQRKANIARDKTNASRSHQFFYKSVWQSAKKKVCFECGEPIPFFDKRFCHHGIYKRLQKNYSINLDGTWNGFLLCMKCHDQTHLDISKTPKIKASTDLLLIQNKQYLIKK